MRKNKKKYRIVESTFDALSFFVAFFIIGLKFSQLIPSKYMLFFLLPPIFALLASHFFKQHRTRHLLVLLVPAFICSGIFYGLIREKKEINQKEYFYLDGSQGTLEGTFKSAIKVTHKSSISFRLTDCIYQVGSDTISIEFPVSITLRNAVDFPEPEQRYQATGTFFISNFNQLPAFKTKKLTPTSFTPAPYLWAGKTRKWLIDGLNAVLPSRHSAIVIGLILGDTSLMEHSDKQLFKETGMSHILAVSGQHIMIITLMVVSILRWLKIPPLSRSIMVSILLCCYSLVAPSSPSISRAILMYISLAIATHSESHHNSILPVSFAAFLILLFDPSLINNPSFQLSFAATIGIITIREPIEYYFNKLMFPQFLSRYFAVSFAANIATIPLSALIFGYISLGSFFVNPAILWLFAYILPYSFLVAFASLISSGIATILASGLSVALDLLLIFLKKAQAIPGILYYTNNSSGILTAAFYAFILLGVGYWKKMQLERICPKVDTQLPLVDTQMQSKINIHKATSDKKTNSQKSVHLKIFRDKEHVSEIENILQNTKRPAIKSIKNNDDLDFPFHKIAIDNQNVLNIILNFQADNIIKTPSALIQAYIYLLSFASAEISSRVIEYYSVSLLPEDFQLNLKVKDRYLASVLLLDCFLKPKFFCTSTNEIFRIKIAEFLKTFNDCETNISYLLTDCQESTSKDLDKFFELRQTIIRWIANFIEFDETQQKGTNNET